MSSHPSFALRLVLVLAAFALEGCADDPAPTALSDASVDVSPAAADLPTVDLTPASADVPSIDAGLALADVPSVDLTPGSAEAPPPTSIDAAPMDSAPDQPWVRPDADVTDGGCPSGYFPAYLEPGCGAEARLACAADIMEACAMLLRFCACDGITTFERAGCGGLSDRPYLHEGPCRTDASIVDGTSR